MLLKATNKIKSGIEENLKIEEIESNLHELIEKINTSKKAQEETLAPINISEFMGHVEPVINWIVGDLIVEGSVILLVAKPKIGKSILAVNIALAVAQGHEIFEKKTTRGRTLYIALEDRERLIQSRLWNMLGKPEEIGFDIYCGDISINKPRFRDHLKETIRENDYKLVVIDPLIQAYSGSDENNPNEMAKVLGFVREIAQETNTSIVVVHHSRKSQGEGGDVIRGSSAIWGAVDGAIILKSLQYDDDIKKVSMEAILRDAESGEKAVISLDDSLIWKLEGTFEEFKVKSTSEKILEYLEDGEATISEISKGIEVNYDTVKKALYRLDGQVKSRTLGNNRNAGKKYFLSHDMSHENVPREKVIDIEDLPKLFDSHGNESNKSPEEDTLSQKKLFIS